MAQLHAQRPVAGRVAAVGTSHLRECGCGEHVLFGEFSVNFQSAPAAVHPVGVTAPPPPPPTMGDDMAFRRNDTGFSIVRMQQALLAWNADSLPTFGADGDYGAESEAAVEAYQLAAQLDQVADSELGVCDGNTYNQLLEFLL